MSVAVAISNNNDAILPKIGYHDIIDTENINLLKEYILLYDDNLSELVSYSIYRSKYVCLQYFLDNYNDEIKSLSSNEKYVHTQYRILSKKNDDKYIKYLYSLNKLWRQPLSITQGGYINLMLQDEEYYKYIIELCNDNTIGIDSINEYLLCLLLRPASVSSPQVWIWNRTIPYIYKYLIENNKLKFILTDKLLGISCDQEILQGTLECLIKHYGSVMSNLDKLAILTLLKPDMGLKWIKICNRNRNRNINNIDTELIINNSTIVDLYTYYIDNRNCITGEPATQYNVRLRYAKLTTYSNMYNIDLSDTSVFNRLREYYDIYTSSTEFNHFLDYICTNFENKYYIVENNNDKYYYLIRDKEVPYDKILNTKINNFIITNKNINETESMCMICFSDITNFISTCNNKHIYCEECIKSWLLRYKDTCPTCKEKLI